MTLTSSRFKPNSVENSHSGKKGPSTAARRQSFTTSRSSAFKSVNGMTTVYCRVLLGKRLVFVELPLFRIIDGPGKVAFEVFGAVGRGEAGVG